MIIIAFQQFCVRKKETKTEMKRSKKKLTIKKDDFFRTMLNSILFPFSLFSSLHSHSLSQKMEKIKGKKVKEGSRKMMKKKRRRPQC